MGEAEARVYEHATDNGGVIGRAEALALGMSARTIDRRIASGRLIGVAHGVLALPGVLQSERSILLAATTALDAVASHESAARLHGLEGLDPERIAVTVPIRRSNRFAGVIVHQTTDLDPEHVVEIAGTPVTDPPRTVIDLAAVLPGRLLADIVDQVARRRLASYELISSRLESLARRGKPGVTKLRNLLQPRLGGSMPTDSTLETRLIELLRRAGLPQPSTQFRPQWLRRINGRVDLAYTEAQVIVEGDSRRWHDSPEAFQTDRRRDNLAQLAGWVILRFTWEDITKRHTYVAASVREALQRTNTR